MIINLIQKEHLDLFWDQIAPLLEKGLFHCEGELNIHQLRLQAVQGTVKIAVGLNDQDQIVGAIALEVVNYPNYRCANVVSYGGEDLFATEQDFAVIKGYLKTIGISFIQGWCRPAQARLFKSRYGFSTPYEMIRLSLKEE